MADVVGAIVGAITSGIQWIRTQYRKFKVWLADALIKALAKGWTAALTIVGLITASIVVGYVWQIMKDNAIVVAVRSFFNTIGGIAKQIATFIHLDLIMSVVNLAVLLNEKLYNTLAPLYDELASFAEELELDAGYISTYLEVDRAILFATYQFTDMGWARAQSEYMTGLSDWLGKLRERMMSYAEDPRKIFTDIQAEITAARVQAASEEVARIWAAINFAGDWVKDKGEILITLAADIDAQVKKMPDDVQKAIAPWYNDAIARVKKFEAERWDPFWKQYEIFTDAVNDAFSDFGMDIEEMKRRIDDPMDWVRSLLALPEKQQATLKGTLDEFLGGLLPVKEEKPAAIAGDVVDSLDGVMNDLMLLASDVDAAKGTSTGQRLPEAPKIVLELPWYETEE